jgi:hypothetical protein
MASPNHFRARKLSRLKNLPVDAVPVAGQSAVITSTTPVAVLAGVTGKCLFLTQLIIHNITIAEDPLLLIASDAAAPVGIVSCLPSTAGGNGGNVQFDFDPPWKVAVDDGITGESDAATGDTYVTANGWRGTPDD